ncbi:HD domain-containing phosphohydrolase [Aliarcobacter butzleri]|uniref:HD domain-containing phosphohydrolase n=1 Tax=Aliarcobacter butzleri TaxID=28197 RepID=UPI00263F6B1F|nr:HD domain-containing phosphohydrolase [Aliarcobacter butzleri]MDN5068570.1 HD domain-containing protein [Aliarcobacter butzleri]
MNYVKILGSSGSKSKNLGTTSFQISRDIIIDTGNVINILGDKSSLINHIFLTHSHSDHIADLPFLLDSFFENRKETLTIYASKETIEVLKEHTFNDKVWPDFSKINLIGSEKESLAFKEIKENEETIIDNYKIKAISATHIEGSFGFVITKNEKEAYIISGDTYINEKIIQEINLNQKIKLLIIECSFPNKMEKLAFDSKHLTPKILKEMLNKINRDIQIFIYHIKHLYLEEIKTQLEEIDVFKNGGKILEDGDIIHINSGKIDYELLDHTVFERVMNINLELSSQLDKDKLYEMILTLTRELTHSDGGTLYIKSDDKKYLDFKIVQNDSLNIHLGGKEKISWNSLPLYLENGEENKSMVAVVSALENRIINIPDVYECENYNFEGTKNFDKSTGYRSKSMLVIPLINHEKDVIGVIQLINKNINQIETISYNEYDERIIKALSSQAAMALTNSQLIISLEKFLESFVSTIASAIDAKSKHTLNHITKMAKLAPLIAQSISLDETIYKDVKYSKNNLKEIELAAKLHDIGKISMPEWIIDKATKLQHMVDGIEVIKERVEILKRDFEIEYLKNIITKEEYEVKISNLEDDFKFIEKANIGSEFMKKEDCERIEKISSYKYYKDNKLVDFINDKEKYNLLIQKGTLTNEEKDKMNSHAQLSYEMLSVLPFPKKYENVMHIAVNHHEKLNGKGYPRGLNENDLVLEDRIMILADIFEALTSNDRPYKQTKKLSEVFKILDFMVKDGEIDGKLLEFFKNSEALKTYINEELLKEQIDDFK